MKSEISQMDGKKSMARYRTFNNVSFGADLYWRFRWAGLIIGSIIFGIIYAYVSRLWYRHAGLNGNVYAVFIALFPLNIFTRTTTSISI